MNTADYITKMKSILDDLRKLKVNKSKKDLTDSTEKRKMITNSTCNDLRPRRSRLPDMHSLSKESSLDVSCE